MELTDKKFEELGTDNTKDIHKEEEDKKAILKESYRNIIDILKKYVDMKEEYYKIISLWIIGTYFHNGFPSYPYLFINAMRGSGKTRLLKIITHLSKDGEMLNSLTEAVLFRTNGTLGIDEFEGVQRKGNEALRELLNSAYKEGTKVKRLRKKKTPDGEKQVVEEFDVYRPIAIANIWGMESVLGDRCINLILEKSFDKSKVNLLEIFQHEEIVKKTKELLNQCSLCSVVTPQNIYNYINIYQEWNNFIENNNTNYTNYTNNTNYTNYITSLKSINLTDLTGRELELCFPLFLMAIEIDPDILDEITVILKDLFKSKKEEEFAENSDISFLDFLAQEPEVDYFIGVNTLAQKFREFLQTNEEWINAKWIGRALKRLNMIIEKKRVARGIEVKINFKKAKEKIKMFK